MTTEAWEAPSKKPGYWRKFFRKQRKFDRDALPKLLAAAPPQGADAVPYSLRFTWAEVLAAIAFHVVLLVFLAFGYVLVFDSPIFIALSVLGIALSFLATQVPDFPIRYRSVTVSGEGVRLVRLFRDDLAFNWWDVHSVIASRDLSRVQLNGRSNVVLLMAQSAMAEGFVQALRAYGAPYSLEVQEWPRRKLVLRRAAPAAFHLASFATILVAMYLAAPGALGMRCSGNSAYMQSTFGTPARTGCVVLRVSAGAAKAGVQKGDLMIEMNGTPITSGRQFSTVFDVTSPPWQIKVIRKGVPYPLAITINPAPSWSFSTGPKDAIAYYLLARGEAADDPAAAIEDYTHVIDLQPDFDLAYLYRAELYSEDDRIGDAQRDFARAFVLSPNFGEANSLYANFESVYGDPSKAQDEINTAIRLDNCEDGFQGLNVDCSYDYGTLAELQWQAPPEEMRNTAERSIDYYSGDPFPYFEAACAHSRLPEMDLAKQRAQQYLAFPADERSESKTTLMQRILEDTPC